MKSFLLSILVISCVVSSSLRAEEDEFVDGGAHFGVVNGVVVGWGWWGIGVPTYGYSYYAYWNYVPYYASFAAISYSPSTGRHGVAWSAPSRWVAETNAYRYCGIGDCRTVAWVQGGCASLSRSSNASTIGWGISTNRLGAAQASRRGCTANGGVGCSELVWACSY
ncbi:MAG: DUF4189 domain-containing protein [Bdellovibrionales bacterium]|nr:DUF4189 domain-containing protein [Bdellovibrionales bacterium]MCB0418400.1 DUF4189 domain-containing protein [Bdellovibrionales bacterium]